MQLIFKMLSSMIKAHVLTYNAMQYNDEPWVQKTYLVKIM